MTSTLKLKHFVLDVDGVLTDGSFYYSDQGKVMKKFGPDDSDALSLLEGKMTVSFISGDKRGFPISQKRVEDMGFPIHLVSTIERIDWIKERFNPQETVYMGDGIFDALVFKHVAYSIAPANAFYKTREMARFVTKAKGGEGAVAEACLHLLEKFFEPFDILDFAVNKGSGIWKKSA